MMSLGHCGRVAAVLLALTVILQPQGATAQIVGDVGDLIQTLDEAPLTVNMMSPTINAELLKQSIDNAVRDGNQPPNIKLKLAGHNRRSVNKRLRIRPIEPVASGIWLAEPKLRTPFGEESLRQEGSTELYALDTQGGYGDVLQFYIYLPRLSPEAKISGNYPQVTTRGSSSPFSLYGLKITIAGKANRKGFTYKYPTERNISSPGKLCGSFWMTTKQNIVTGSGKNSVRFVLVMQDRTDCYHTAKAASLQVKKQSESKGKQASTTGKGGKKQQSVKGPTAAPGNGDIKQSTNVAEELPESCGRAAAELQCSFCCLTQWWLAWWVVSLK